MTRLLDRTRLLSTAVGLVMAAAAGLHTTGMALVVAILAALTVLVGMRFRPVSTLAVLLAGAGVLLADTPPLLAAVAGLSAACYLTLRHAHRLEPAMVAALGFTVIGVAVATVPIQLPWLPLLAPLAVVAVYLLAVWPFFKLDNG